jgi:hypothetical protein
MPNVSEYLQKTSMGRHVSQFSFMKWRKLRSTMCELNNFRVYTLKSHFRSIDPGGYGFSPGLSLYAGYGMGATNATLSTLIHNSWPKSKTLTKVETKTPLSFTDARFTRLVDFVRRRKASIQLSSIAFRKTPGPSLILFQRNLATTMRLFLKSCFILWDKSFWRYGSSIRNPEYTQCA